MKNAPKIISLFLIFSLNVNPAFAEKYTVAPKVGQCFMHTLKDVDASSPKKIRLLAQKSILLRFFMLANGHHPLRLKTWSTKMRGSSLIQSADSRLQLQG